MMIRLGKMRGFVVAAAMSIAGVSGATAQTGTPIAVYKSPTCGCCSKWVEHLRASGFAPAATNTSDMSAVKAKYHVPRAAESCHTAIVGGYVIEGHVPAADIRRLLKEKPAVIGLAAPGMPMGSPGMEGPVSQKYDVVSFDREGRTRVYATHGG
ncbi:MAG: DUF411 domain-containing protein [Acidobacteriota bacterium]